MARACGFENREKKSPGNSPVCRSTRRNWPTWRSAEALDFAWALDLLSALNVARDLSPLRSVGLHKLKGDRKGQWAMTVNARWRICFVFRKGDAYDVEIVDYHKG